MDFLGEAIKYLGEFAEVRRDIHAHPELGGHEIRTSGIVMEKLASFGIPCKQLTGTAVMGVLDCGPCPDELDSAGEAGRDQAAGNMPVKTIAFRADMDALPLEEETSCPFASTTQGIMHACGHDVHTAALLETVKILSLHRGELCGSIRFFFEPDEEGDGGALRMIDAGCMKGVSAVYGAHVDPKYPLGTVALRYGRFYAASIVFDVAVHGRSAHGAYPEEGVDALSAAAEMVLALRALPGNLGDEECVVTTGQLNAGTASNIIAEQASFCGIIRAFGDGDSDALLRKFEDRIEAISSAYGAKTDIRLQSTHNGVVNTKRETDLVRQAASACGFDVAVMDKPLPVTEDFGYFIDEAGAGSFYHIGVGGSNALHSSRFLPDDEAIANACAAHLAVAYHELAVS